MQILKHIIRMVLFLILYIKKSLNNTGSGHFCITNNAGLKTADGVVISYAGYSRTSNGFI